jgi:hypothetical protein
MPMTKAPNRRWFEKLPCTQAGALLGLLLFAIGSIPFLYAWRSTPADAIYTGLMFDVPDHAQYWSWVTASRHGLFIANTMTPEPNPPIFLNPMMWGLAQVQQLTSLSFAGLFQLWRLLAALIVGIAIVMGFRAFVPDRTRRAAAYAMALIGSGFGWILVIEKYRQHLADVPFPQDLYTVEPNTFFALFAYPYLALAQGLLLLTFLGVWRVHGKGAWQGYVLAIGGAMALALTHAYDLVTVYAVIGAFWLFELVRTRAIPWRLTIAGAAVAGASGPIALYYQRLTAADPLWRALLAQYANAGVWTPPHFHLIILMGLPLLLALLWIAPALRGDGNRNGDGNSNSDGDAPDAFAAVWAIVGLGLIYLPVVYQIKLLTAWQFPIAILAANAWHARVLPWLAARRVTASPRVALAMIVLLIVPTNAYLFAWRLTELRRHERPYFLHRDEMAALNWLAAHAGPDDVVMAKVEMGQFVPNYGATRAFLAHWAMTDHFFQRRDEAERFFSVETPDSFRQQVLDRDAVTLVLQTFGDASGNASGDASRDASDDARGRGRGFDPHTSPLFEPLFVTPHAAIFRYREARHGDTRHAQAVPSAQR